jgi:hypothetical protein
MKQWFRWTKEKRKELIKWYKDNYGKDFVPPSKDSEIESLPEMKEIMEEPPNYPIDKQGRER